MHHAPRVPTCQLEVADTEHGEIIDHAHYENYAILIVDTP